MGVGAEQLLIVGQEPTVLAVGASTYTFLVSPIVSLFFLPLSTEKATRQTKILSQRAVKPKLTNQPLFLSVFRSFPVRRLIRQTLHFFIFFKSIPLSLEKL